MSAFSTKEENNRRGERTEGRSRSCRSCSSGKNGEAQEGISKEEGKACCSSRRRLHSGVVQQHDCHPDRSGWPRGELGFGWFGGLQGFSQRHPLRCAASG